MRALSEIMHFKYGFRESGVGFHEIGGFLDYFGQAVHEQVVTAERVRMTKEPVPAESSSVFKPIAEPDPRRPARGQWRRSSFVLLALLVVLMAVPAYFALKLTIGPSGVGAREAAGEALQVGFVLMIPAAAWSAMIWLGTYVADQKGRSRSEGAMFAALLGPLGLLVFSLLPDAPRGVRH